MKKTRDSITIFYDNSCDNSEDEAAPVSPISKSSSDCDSMNRRNSSTTPIKLTSMGAVQLTSSSNSNSNSNSKSQNATNTAILNLKQNPFYHEKRRWDDSFTVAEKKELTGNIVKAARDNDGANLITLQEEQYRTSNLSPEEDEDSQESDADSANGQKPGRKPMPDEAPSDPDQDPKVKRKAQNRAAQRAFRERKERYVKELEAKIKQVQDTHLIATTQLVRENQQLRSIIYRLEVENYALKGIPMQPYQHQTALPPQPQPPLQQQTQRHSNGNGTSNYPNIAPLLPQQQPLLLPSYLSNSCASPVSSIIPPHSPSVNQMMMSSVVSTNLINGKLNSSPNTNQKIAMPKKSPSKKNHTPAPLPNIQPLEYTFSISTPASLKPSGGSTSSSKHARTEPVELVQLYPPGVSRNQPSNNNNSTDGNSVTTLQKSDLALLSARNGSSYVKKARSVTSVSSQGSLNNNTTTVTTPRSTNDEHQLMDDNSSIVSDKTNSTVNTQQQRKNMQQLEIDMFDCHIDTEGQIFCERLHNEVCNDAFNRLLSEPLFDQMGKLNLSISNYPVPIVTGSMSLSLDEEEQKTIDGSDSSDDQERGNKDDAVISEQQKKTDLNKEVDDIFPNTPKSPALPNTTVERKKRLLTCREIWFILNQHEKFGNYRTDQLCQAVKELAKCADSGPVLEEADMFQIMTKMDQGCL